LEDGTITCDFYYLPGQYDVHPALGSTVFLLDPEGVKRHRLAVSGQSDPARGDDSDSASQRGGKLPLKPDSWNSLTVAVRGDVVALTLNDRVIFEGPIASIGPRYFGLFHYAGDTQVRVRNIIYRGDWPTTLPTLQDQELANQP
jgi:hypothetical protein